MAASHNKQISFKYRFPTWNHQQVAERKLQFPFTGRHSHTNPGTDKRASLWSSPHVWLPPTWLWWTRCFWLRRRDTERVTGGKEVTLTSFSLTANEQRVRENRQPACCHDCCGWATVVRLFAGWCGSCCPVAAPSTFRQTGFTTHQLWDQWSVQAKSSHTV